jgi:quercetin dioxygenase-like cupin family protein
MSNSKVCLSKQILTGQLERVDNTEMVVSITTVPPHTKLPKCSQDAEGFTYVLEGFFVLHLEGRPDEFYMKGDAWAEPIRQAHSVSTQEEGAVILICHVHEMDQV